jgi:prepilin-type N-terminal cleavage/methylation domain-containing protein
MKFLKKMNWIFQGFTLVEIMVAMGISSVMMLGIMRVLDLGIKGEKRIRTNMEISQSVNEAEGIISKNTACLATLSGLTKNQSELLIGFNYDVDRIKNNNATNTYFELEKVRSGLKIVDMNIDNCSPFNYTSNRTIQLNCDFNIVFERTYERTLQRSADPSKRKTKFPITMTFRNTDTSPLNSNSRYTISSCSSETDITTLCTSTGYTFTDTGSIISCGDGSQNIKTIIDNQSQVVTKLQDLVNTYSNKIAALQQRVCKLVGGTNTGVDGNCNRDCYEAGGSMDENLCKIRGHSCPPGWSYAGYTETEARSHSVNCGGANYTYNTGQHSYAQKVQEYTDFYVCGTCADQHTGESSCGKNCTSTFTYYTYRDCLEYGGQLWAAIKMVGCM